LTPTCAQSTYDAHSLYSDYDEGKEKEKERKTTTTTINHGLSRIFEV
jgi:hypothetical protein